MAGTVRSSQTTPQRDVPLRSPGYLTLPDGKEKAGAPGNCRVGGRMKLAAALRPFGMIPSTYSPQGAASPDPVYTYRMAISPGRVRGGVSPFREGSLALTSAGFQLDGKTILPTGQRVAILILSALFLGAIVASLLLEYVFRVRRSISVKWEALEEVVLVSAEQKACLVYRSPEKPENVDCLAFRMDPVSFAHFVQVARYFVPDRVREGKIGGPTSPREIWITLLVLGLMILGAVVLVMATGKR